MSTLSRRDLLVGTASAFGAASCARAIPDSTCASNYVPPNLGTCPAEAGALPAPPPAATARCELFAFDEIERASPHEVVHPASEAELARLLQRLCADPRDRRVTVRGGGQSLDSQSLGNDVVV